MPSPEQMARLDLRNLASATEEEARAALRSAEAGLSRGVDLAALKAKRQHEHRWVVVAQFEMPDKTINLMSERRLALANRLAAGDDSVPEDGGTVPMPMGEDNLVHSEGPGCVKCGVHWEHENAGYGVKCSVSDEDWLQQRAMQDQAIAAMSQQNFIALVQRQVAVIGNGKGEGEE